MKLRSTYTTAKFEMDIFVSDEGNPRATYTLDANINNGYPMMTKWIGAVVEAFDPSSTKMTGEGTQASPYIITTQDQFKAMANYYNTKNAKKDLYWKISPFKSSSPTPQITFELGNTWVPIGYDQAHAFTGHLDGGRVVITGLGITTNYEYVGLFGYVASGATISNLGISATTGNINDIAYDYDQASYIGGLVGYLAEGAYINRCYFIGKLTGYLNTSATHVVGGLAGYYKDVVSGSTVTPAITKSYYIADHKTYIKSGSTINTQTDHMEKIYGTGSTTSSGVFDDKDFTAQSTFTPYGFTFGNLTLVSGSSTSYEWTSAYANKWHTTAGIYNGYPYLDASDDYSYRFDRSGVTGGTISGNYKLGNESKGSLVFNSNLSQYLPYRANVSFVYTRTAANASNYDVEITLEACYSFPNNSSTSVSISNTINASKFDVSIPFGRLSFSFPNNSSTSLSIPNTIFAYALRPGKGGTISITDSKHAKHTLTVTNSTPDLGLFVRNNAGKDDTETDIPNGKSYLNGMSSSGKADLTFTANASANSTYYFIKKITVGGATLYSSANPSTINSVANCSASIASSLDITYGGYASVINLTFRFPSTTGTTAIVVEFGKVVTAKQSIIYNTENGVETETPHDAPTLTIVPGTKVADPNTSNKRPSKSEGLGGTFIGWIEKKTGSDVGNLISSADELDFTAETDTESISELWSDVAANITFTLGSGKTYTMTHALTGISYALTSSMSNVMVGDWIITDLTIGKTAILSNGSKITSSTTTLNLTTLTWS